MEHKKHKTERKKRKAEGGRLNPYECFALFAFCFVLFVLKQAF